MKTTVGKQVTKYALENSGKAVEYTITNASKITNYVSQKVPNAINNVAKNTVSKASQAVDSIKSSISSTTQAIEDIKNIRIGLLDTGIGIKFPTIYKNEAQSIEESAMKSVGSAGGGASKYRALTKNNYGYNFDVYYGKGPFYLADGTIIQNLAKHHVYPQAYEKKFAELGINIHDPKYIVPVDNLKGLEDNHSSFSKAYNAKWDVFFKNASDYNWSTGTAKKEAENLAKQFAKDYNYLYHYIN